jgi:hypothetical protein
MRIGYIYLVQYKDIRYIGSCWNPKQRWSKGYCGEIQKYFEEFGKENFTFSILKKYLCVDQKHRFAYEQLMINRVNCVNNLMAFDPMSICIHNRQRHQCKDCGGSSICEHKRLRNYCIYCSGSSICPHNRLRNYCIDCSPYYCSLCDLTTSIGNSNRHEKTKKHQTNLSNHLENIHFLL